MLFLSYERSDIDVDIYTDFDMLIGLGGRCSMRRLFVAVGWKTKTSGIRIDIDMVTVASVLRLTIVSLLIYSANVSSARQDERLAKCPRTSST